MYNSQRVIDHINKVSVSDQYLAETPFTLEELHAIANYKKDPIPRANRTSTRKIKRTKITSSTVVNNSNNMSYEDRLHKAGLTMPKPMKISDFYR